MAEKDEELTWGACVKLRYHVNMTRLEGRHLLGVLHSSSSWKLLVGTYLDVPR